MVCLKSWVAAGVRRRSVGDLVGDLPGQEEEEAPVAVAGEGAGVRQVPPPSDPTCCELAMT